MFTPLYQNTHLYILQTQAHLLTDSDQPSDKTKTSVGGCSLFDDCFGGYNMALHVHDNSTSVLNNRSHLLQNLNAQFGTQRIAWAKQVHGNLVCWADSLQAIPQADSLITDQACVALAMMTADCVPIALFDEQYIACVHAGTQGLACGVIANTVRYMSRPCAYIGACISQINYQLPKSHATDIINQAIHCKALNDTPDEMMSGKNQSFICAFDFYYQTLCQAQDDDKVLFDVGKMARLQLKQLGVLVINDNMPCSYADDRYYSHRQAMHHKLPSTGRMAMIIAKK